MTVPLKKCFYGGEVNATFFASFYRLSTLNARCCPGLPRKLRRPATQCIARRRNALRLYAIPESIIQYVKERNWKRVNRFCEKPSASDSASYPGALPRGFSPNFAGFDKKHHFGKLLRHLIGHK